MKSAVLLVGVSALLVLSPVVAAEPEQRPRPLAPPEKTMPDRLAGKRVVFLGDSITQAGGYITLIDYQLTKLYPEHNFTIYGLGLASETLSGLSEDNHADGAFPRPCLFERLGRLLERAEPEVIVACYGINDGIYLPFDAERFSAFQQGVKRLIDQCQAAGVRDIVLVTPPIYDATTEPGEFNYDTVMAKYAAWEMTLDVPGVQVVDLHSAMRKARDAQAQPFSKDRIHPGGEGHWLMAKTILAALGVPVPDQSLATIQADPLYQEVDQLRKHRSTRWMKHIGYTREKTVPPQPLGDTEEVSATIQERINRLRQAE